MTVSPGARIKYLRLLADMSQEELGKRVGVQRAAINKYEKGKVENIPIKTIEKIAHVFDVSPSYIVGWNGDEGNPLSAEVKVLQGVKKFYGNDTVELIESYMNLNSIGKERVFQYIDDISPTYSKREVLVESTVEDSDFLEELGFEKIERTNSKTNAKLYNI